MERLTILQRIFCECKNKIDSVVPKLLPQKWEVWKYAPLNHEILYNELFICVFSGQLSNITALFLGEKYGANSNPTPLIETPYTYLLPMNDYIFFSYLTFCPCKKKEIIKKRKPNNGWKKKRGKNELDEQNLGFDFEYTLPFCKHTSSVTSYVF